MYSRGQCQFKYKTRAPYNMHLREGQTCTHNDHIFFFCSALLHLSWYLRAYILYKVGGALEPSVRDIAQRVCERERVCFADWPVSPIGIMHTLFASYFFLLCIFISRFYTFFSFRILVSRRFGEYLCVFFQTFLWSLHYGITDVKPFDSFKGE